MSEASTSAEAPATAPTAAATMFSAVSTFAPPPPIAVSHVHQYLNDGSPPPAGAPQPVYTSTEGLATASGFTPPEGAVPTGYVLMTGSPHRINSDGSVGGALPVASPLSPDERDLSLIHI